MTIRRIIAKVARQVKPQQSSKENKIVMMIKMVFMTAIITTMMMMAKMKGTNTWLKAYLKVLRWAMKK